MKNSLLFFVALTFVVTTGNLLAQTSSAGAQSVEITADDLKVMVRKMAGMRRQRIMAWQQQQILMQRQSARRQKASAYPGSPSVNDASTEVVKQNSTDDPAELAEIRRRLDRQEALLMEIRDRSLTSTVVPATDRSDTIVQQIIGKQQAEKGLDKAEQQTLANEISRMNTELNSLRRRLADEEDRRHRAELETERIRNNNATPLSDDWDDEQRLYERDLNRRRAREEEDRTRARVENRDKERLRYERERREERRNDNVAPAAVRVVEKEASVLIVRDTVVVDRISTTPVYIPTEVPPDTVVVIKETVREVSPDTVMVERDREVVRTDTLQLKATEPIGFPTIFFDNNSSTLNAAHRNLLATTARGLSGKTGYTVRITGFASPSGNASYNQALSMKRAQAVRLGLEAAGLQSDLIYLVPGGIDYEPASPAAARRVEIKAIPK